MSEYRALNINEIQLLTAQNCTAENWDWIEVKEGFNAQRISNTNFTGKIKLGNLNKWYELEG